MRIILFGIILGTLMFTTLMGFHKGFLKTLVSMCPLLIGFVLVFFLATPVSNFIDEHTSLRSSVQTTVYETLVKKATEEYAESNEEQKQAAEGTFLPTGILDSYENNDNLVAQVTDDYTTSMSKYVGEMAIKLAGVLVVLLISFVLLKTLSLIFGFVEKIPLIGGVNKIAGGVIGFARGLIIVWILFFVITTFSNTSLGQQALEAIKSSEVLNLFYSGAMSFGSIFFG